MSTDDKRHRRKRYSVPLQGVDYPAFEVAVVPSAWLQVRHGETRLISPLRSSCWILRVGKDIEWDIYACDHFSERMKFFSSDETLHIIC